MKNSEIKQEAIRNTLSGTSRPLLFATLLILSIAFAGIAEIRTVLGFTNDAVEFRTSGASVQIIDASGAINGASCDALSDIEGVRASGALRMEKDVFVATVLPDSSIPIATVTPNFIELLNITDQNDTPGVFVSETVSSRLGRTTGDTVQNDDKQKDIMIRGVYDWQDAGQAVSLGYIMLDVEPSNDIFDSCWVDIWPQSSSLTSLLWTTIDANTVIDPKNQPKISQLNGKLGTEFRGSLAFPKRITNVSYFLLLIIAFALGYVSVRIRRLELASNLHAGISRKAQFKQLQIETLFWSLISAVICLPILMFAAHSALPDDQFAFAVIIIKFILLAVLGTQFGAAVATKRTDEKHLFRYFKER